MLSLPSSIVVGVKYDDQRAVVKSRRRTPITSASSRVDEDKSRRRFMSDIGEVKLCCIDTLEHDY